MIMLSEELKEYLEIARDKENEEETDICADLLYLLMLLSSDFLHECDEDCLISSYADFVDGRAITLTTIKEHCTTNALTIVALDNHSEDWRM